MEICLSKTQPVRLNSGFLQTNQLPQFVIGLLYVFLIVIFAFFTPAMVCACQPKWYL